MLSDKSIIRTSSFPGKSVDFDDKSDTSSNLSLNIQAIQRAYHKRSQHSGLSGLSDDVRNELSFIVVPNNLMVFILYLLLWISGFLLGLQLDWSIEVMPPIDCHIKQLENVSWSLAEKFNITSPGINNYREGCTYYNRDYVHLAKLSYEDAVEKIQNDINKPDIVQCKNYTIRTEYVGRISFADTYNLTCSTKFWQQPRMYFGLGSVILQIPVGFFADVYGRKPVYIGTAIVLTLSSFVATLLPNLGIFILAYCLVGVSLRGLTLCLLVIFSEIFRHCYRDFMTTFAIVALQLGISLHSVTGTLFTHWRLQHLSYAIGTLILLSGIMFIPESPSFLLINHQYKTTWSTLHELGSEEVRQAAHDAPFPEHRIRKQLRLLKESYFKHRVCMSIILYGISLIINCVFESVIIRSIPTTKMLNLQLLVMKIITLVIIAVLATSFSKKSLCCSIYVLIALCFIMSHFIQSQPIEDAVVVMAKTLFRPLLAIIIVYIVDMFPTTHRCTAFSLNISIGAIIVLIYLYFREQLIIHLESHTLSTFYFSVCMMCAFVSLLGPRTYEDLPETKDDLVSENAPEDFSIFSNNS